MSGRCEKAAMCGASLTGGNAHAPGGEVRLGSVPATTVRIGEDEFRIRPCQTRSKSRVRGEEGTRGPHPVGPVVLPTRDVRDDVGDCGRDVDPRANANGPCRRGARSVHRLRLGTKARAAPGGGGLGFPSQLSRLTPREVVGTISWRLWSRGFTTRFRSRTQRVPYQHSIWP